MSDTIISVQEKNFETLVLQSKKPVLVDFWAPWCGPCLAMSPTLEDFAKNDPVGKKVAVVKIDIDENPDIAAQHGIRSIPTFIVFKDGKAAARKVGSSSRAELAKLVAPYTDNAAAEAEKEEKSSEQE